MNDFEKNIVLFCPVCGNDQFASLDVDDNANELINADDNIRFECSDCKAIYTKAELIEANSENIELNIKDAEEEIIKSVEKQLKKAFKKWR